MLELQIVKRAEFPGEIVREIGRIEGLARGLLDQLAGGEQLAEAPDPASEPLSDRGEIAAREAGVHVELLFHGEEQLSAVSGTERIAGEVAEKAV